MSSPKFSPLAEEDLAKILERIAQDKPVAAERWVAKIRETCWTLARFPLLGTARTSMAESVRSFTVGHYVIYYRPEEGTVRIERVLHSSRDVDSIV